MRDDGLPALDKVACASVDQQAVEKSTTGIGDDPGGHGARRHLGNVFKLRAQRGVFNLQPARRLHPADKAFVFLAQPIILGMNHEEVPHRTRNLLPGFDRPRHHRQDRRHAIDDKDPRILQGAGFRLAEQHQPKGKRKQDKKCKALRPDSDRYGQTCN